MKDSFPGYYPLSNDQMKAFLSDAIIVFDVNALLDLFRIEENQAKTVLKVLKDDKISKRLWIPYDVAWLYHKQMNTEIMNQINNVNSALSYLKSCKDIISNSKSYPFLPTDKKTRLEALVLELNEFCSSQKEVLINQLKTSTVKADLGMLFHDKIGISYTEAELENIYKEGDQRFSKLVPPGYMPCEISDSRIKYHDLIIWKQILAYAGTKHKDIILVSGKIKIDWYYVVKDEEVVPRQEMINEFMSKTGKRYYSFSLSKFMKKCHEDLDIPIQNYELLINDLKELADKLSCYLDNKNHQKDIPFFTLFHHNVSFIDKVYHNADTTEEQKKVILYSRLQAENTFSDPLKYLSLINELTLQPANSLYDCLLQADKNEIELSATKREEFSEKAKNIIVDLESELKKTTDENIKFELLHHIGKLYVKLREGENAKPYFENALMICPKAYATMLQLAKIAHNSKPSDISKAKEYVSTILDDNIKGHDVPLTIVLACYSVFLSKKAYSDLEDKYIESNFENFSNVIMNSLLNFNNQAVPTLGSFAYSFAYIKPEFMRRTFELLQKLPAASSDNVYIRACANLKAVEYKLEIDKKSDKAKTIFKEAEYYFELLNLKEKEEGRSKDYMRKRYQELLMDAEEWKQALEFSANFDDKDSEFYYQNVAKIYQNLQDYPLAIENIDKAIAKVSDTDYKSSFFWNKACILYDMGDKESLKILQEAIDMRKEDKAKDEWKEMLNKWTMNFKPKADVNI